MRRLAVILFLSLGGCSSFSNGSNLQTIAAPTQPVHLAEQSPLDLRIDGELVRGIIPLPLEKDSTDVNLGSGRVAIPVCVVEGERETCVTLQPDEPQGIVIRYLGQDRTILLSYLGPQASFPSEYRARHSGAIDIEVPAAYELVNVAIALTPYARENPGLAAASPYLDEVRARFADQNRHPFVLGLDALMREDGSAYHPLKMSGASFELSGDNIVSRSPIYKSTGWGSNELLPLMDDMQDFAQATDFANFYAEHLPLYSSQIAYLRNDVDVDAMIAWLGAEFPDVTPYDHTRILFSPLVGYNQSVNTFEDEGFRQLMPHVNFPYPEKDDAQLSDDALQLYRGLILFTELNHGYINPTIDGYSAAIQDAMLDMSVWVSNETAGGYGNDTGVFAEMMNWALISVRAYDVLPESEADKIAARVERIMVRNRGFPRFGPFQKRLLELTRDRDEGASVASVFPSLIASLPSVETD